MRNSINIPTDNLEKTISVNSIYNFFYILLMYLICILPTTKIYFKLIIGILLILSIFVVKKINVYTFLLILFLATVLLFTFAQGLQNGFNTYSKEEFFSYLGAIMVAWIGFNTKLKKEVLLKHLYNAIGLYLVIKIFLCILVMVGFIDIFQFIDLVKAVFDYKIVTYLINDQLNLYRLYLINDLMLLVVPYLYFWLKHNNKVSKLDSIILVLSCIGILLSYSRALIASYFILLLFSSFLVSSTKKIKVIFSLCIFLVSIILVCNYLNLTDSFVDRFSSNSVANDFSDEYRGIQKRALIQEINQHAVNGIGLGGYSIEFPGIENVPYSYENQWYAAFMKFGLIKFILFFGSIILSLFILLRKNKVALMHLVVLFMLPFTNPYLTSIQFSVILMILVISTISKYEN
ncbi:O-antigen ligase family protein [Bacillus sp. GB_SG_008]|uniref:O-antigen ligase family protein n=1 Tax=Bacillus sp. GB_SG_008 TaxID=3454627 RepID=UPI003F868793